MRLALLRVEEALRSGQTERGNEPCMVGLEYCLNATIGCSMEDGACSHGRFGSRELRL